MILLKNIQWILLFYFFMTIGSAISPNVDIIPLVSEHRQSVINLLISSFFIQEPLNAMLKFDIPQEILTWAEFLVDTSIDQQCSFIAVDNTSNDQNVIGVILNGIAHRDDQEEMIDIQSDKLKFVLSLLDKVVVGYDLFEFYETDRLFHCDIINVDERRRGQQLSTRLIQASESKARQLGIKGIYVICSGSFSKRAFQRHEFKVINEILYSQYDHEQLSDMGEHDRCSLLGKHL